VFIDEINRKNPTPKLGKIESTNPCGEQPLYSYESCNLGSINLAKFATNGKIDWDRLKEVITTAVHFLDNVIDINKYPLKQIKKITKANRKIGLGVMGFAELLIQLNISYDSKKAVSLAEKLMKFVSKEARQASIDLAEIRGSFPNFRKSIWAKKYERMRNATLTTIAPTGTISIIAGCSSGIEPLFAVSFIRNVLDGTKLVETNPYFEALAKEQKFYSKQLMKKIAKTGTTKNIKQIPPNIKRIFKTALDIKPEWHVQMQAAFQKYTDNAVSKTINFPPNATLADVRKAYLLAWKLKCKGITIYRYGSKAEQVLYLGAKIPYVSAESEFAGGCPYPYCPH
jgi:ribonucleoside-diphosphate reductase alpha chain